MIIVILLVWPVLRERLQMSDSSILENIVSISSFGRGESSKNFLKAKEAPVIVVKNNIPEAVIVTAAEYKRLTGIEEDYLLLSESLRRLGSDSAGSTLSQDDVLSRLGVTQEDIEAAEEAELD